MITKMNNTIVLAPKTPATTLEAVLSELTTFFASPRKRLSDTLASFVLGGGTELLANPVAALPVTRIDGLCGYNYSFQNKMIGSVRFGLSMNGYFLVQTQVFNGPSTLTTHYFHADGSFAYRENALAHSIAFIKDDLMDANCPILNYLYNLLASDYADAVKGTANTRRAHTIELFLRKIARTRRSEFSFRYALKDKAVIALNQKMMKTDLDPVLTWKERREIFQGIKTERAVVLNTKRRAHRLNLFAYRLPVLLEDLVASIKRFVNRPVDNALGVMDRIFVDPVRWFFKVVRGNMGYSIALGIYSPFTYFFITQPMNPHATWAVGKVRSAYIETTEKINHIFHSDEEAKAAAALIASASAATPQSNGVDWNSLGSAKQNNYSAWVPGPAGILLSTNVNEVNQQNWEERMSNFKALQISYEQNMEFAPRFGRLEQMETQFNWPLIVESTWLETERYLDQIQAVEASAQDYRPEFVAYVRAEKKRTNQIQYYLWDRNIRFILDHPYTMMDQSQEQTQFDYYLGRAFVMLKDMTDTLRAKDASLLMPQGYDKIQKLADHFQSEYKNGNSIFERLKNNSKLFAQKDAYDTKELREYMKRQWEVLYLLQNRAQEPSNFGLQMYNWSIRNAVFITQSILSAKREELTLLSNQMKKDGGHHNVNISTAIKRNDSQLEALFHMMVLEYTSIRKEIGESLKKDLEATQRRTLIANIETFLKEREALLKGAKIL